MRAKVIEKIQESLSKKRDQLQEWVQTATEEEKVLTLGPSSPAAVQSHIRTLSDSIEKINEGTLGTCEVCDGSVEIDRLELDYTCCVCLDHYSVAEMRSLEQELELAQSVQRSLLPKELPQIPGLQLSAYSRPAQVLGGDYFDFATFEDGRACLAIADVAGHGVSASLHMASLQAMLRSIVPDCNQPSEVVGRIHELFVHNIHFTTFVSLFVAAYDPNARTLAYCNAGHNPPILMRAEKDADGSMVLLSPTGPAIGLIEGAAYREELTQMQTDDLLLMYTDGLVEATNPDMEMFGMQRLQTLLEEHCPLTAETAIQQIRLSLDEFVQGNPLADDTTILACNVV
jgi:sigma-B regulation protein RsbU (phosphoserine phosphatase)